MPARQVDRAMSPVAHAMWARVEELAGRTASVEALRMQGLHLIAARTQRARGEPISLPLRLEQQRAAARALAAPAVLRRVRTAYDGPLVLLKGPEIAAHYPEPTMRPYIDLDILLDDVRAAREALLACGFIEVGDPARYAGAHHPRPLLLPEVPLPIELHERINAPAWLCPPPTAALLELTQPSRTGVPGLRAPLPAVHALILAMHGWAHEPLRRLLDLVDVAAALEGEDLQVADELARRWGMAGLWQTTLGALDWLLYQRRRAPAARIWARHLPQLRERTVLEAHLARFAGRACGAARPGPGALAAATSSFAAAARKRGDERWRDAARRTCLALADAFLPQSRHNEAIELRSEQ